MRRVHFTKMQGTGNDYVYVDLFSEHVKDPAALAVQMAKPSFGVGADGLVLIGPSESEDFSMRIFNADGSEGEMCGNACRCIGKYVYERGLTDRTDIRLETKAGRRVLHLTVSDGRVSSVRVNMGRPDLRPGAVPVLADAAGGPNVRLMTSQGEKCLTCVSMGNPHAVLFVEDVEQAPVSRLGPEIEHHAMFPARTNVEFVRIVDRQHLAMRVWERGSGETLACGTGACAALVAAVTNGLADRTADVSLLGGTIRVSWEADGCVYQDGPAAFVFEGDWPEEGESYVPHQ